jgi:hypothetical protein
MLIGKRAFFSILVLILLYACESAEPTIVPTTTLAPSRAEVIPADIITHRPSDDAHPPILHSDEWDAPIPMPGPVNSAGAEDSPFMAPDGQLFFFFFTPDVRIPVERQLVDGVTGIYVSKRVFGGWSEPELIVMHEPGEVALNGCEFYQDGQLWFCTVRTGLMREIDVWLADFNDSQASNWRSAGEELNLDVGLGEFHFSSDWQTVYFHSDLEEGQGGIDLYVSHLMGDSWSTPENVVELNTPDHDGWPYLTPDSTELFFTRTYLGSPGVFRSRWTGEQWSEAELILSQFAGEPTLDEEGNLYFVHHYFRDGNMLEADIYVAYKK